VKNPGSHNYSQSELLQLVRSKEEWAVGYLFYHLERYLKNRLRTRTADCRNYSNLVASRTVTIIIEKQEVPILTGKLLSFAIGIAEKQWSLIEQKKHEFLMASRFFDDIASTEDIYQEVEDSERRLFVNRCLHRINEKCQKLLLLFCKDLTPEEAYQEMGYASKRVYQVKKSECVNRLKEEIEKSPEYAELFNLDPEEPSDE
jgi:hypothetical protein